MSPIYSGNLEDAPEGHAPDINTLGTGSWGSFLGARAAQSLLDGPVSESISTRNLTGASRGEDFYPDENGGIIIPRAPSPEVDRDTAEAEIKSAGLDHVAHLPDNKQTFRREYVDLLISQNKAREERQARISEGPKGFIAGAFDVGTSLLVGAIDPLNIAAGFIPVVGEARYGKMLAGAFGGGVIGRTAVRAGVGAAQGAAFSTALTPIEWLNETAEGRDFGMADALHSVLYGAGSFALMHTAGGAFSDLYRAARGRPLYPFGPGEPLDRTAAAGAAPAPGAPETPPSLPGEPAPAAAEPLQGDGLPHDGANPDAPASLADNARILDEALPPRSQEDLMRGAIAQLREGDPVEAGKLIEAAAATDPETERRLEQAAVAMRERQFEADRETIAARLRADLIAAGRPEEEATHLAAIESANIVTLARQFEGRAGTALDIYNREGASYRGPGDLPASPSHLTEEDRRVMEELFQTDSQEAGRRNEQGFILRLPYEDRWGDPRFNPEDRAKALARMAEIEKMPVKTAPWADLVQAKHDIDEVIAQLLYYKPETPIEEFRNFSDVEHELYLRRKKQNLGHDDSSPPSHLDLEGVPEDIRGIVGSARTALDHLIDTDRRGVDDMLSYGREDEPKQRARPGERIRKPVDVSQTLPSGFHFMAGRKLADVPDALFPQGGWAVINWLRQKGVTVAEVQHFHLDEKLGNKKPVTREDFQQAIADRMFDFKRKTSWLNPERSPNDYNEGGTRAFTGPRIPGRGMYFERLMAFPKSLKGGEPFAPGMFESPHWQGVHKGTWASWRGSVREIPEWGKTVLGEEGQSDFMQGAMGRGDDWTGRRPRLSDKEYLALKAERPKYEEAIRQARTAYDTISLYLSEIPSGAEARRVLDNALSYGAHNRAELNRVEWDTAIDALRHDVEQIDKSAPAYEYRIKSTREAIGKLADLRTANEKFFEPGAVKKYASTESSFTPESPIDETYVRTMVRDLVMQAIKEKADSIAIATSETTGRIQNNPGAAHFYDEQLRPALQRELRRLTGDGSITLEKVKLPKAMGAPRNEKPYTVWAAKLEPAVYQGAKQKGFTLFQREAAPPFYSAVERAIASAKQDKASPQQWLGTLKNMAGVKPEELEWLGLDDWLKEQKGQVTRAEIEHYVKSNRTLIREVAKGEAVQEPLRKASDEAVRLQARRDREWRDIPAGTPESKNAYQDYRAAVEAADAAEEALRNARTKYGETTLPGGQNYREFLLTLPPRAPIRKTYTVEPPRNPSGVAADREWRILDEAGNHIESRRTEGAARQRAGELSDITAENSAEDYTKGHFDEPNVVAHIRFDDRTIDGKKTLFIQEVQSDWHQQGKKKGYGDLSAEERATLEQTRGDLEEKHRALQPEIERLGEQGDRTHAKRVENLLSRQPALRSDRDAFFVELKRDEIENTTWGKRLHELHAEDRALRDEIAEVRGKLYHDRVPDAPFKTTWPELTLKRMIRHAAEQGYDQISWPASAEAVAQVEDWGKIENRDGKWFINGDKDVTPIVERYLTDMPRIANKIGKKFDAKVGRAEVDTGEKPNYRIVDRYEPQDPARPDRAVAARSADGALLGTAHQESGSYRVIADRPDGRLNELAPTLDAAKRLIEDFVTGNEAQKARTAPVFTLPLTDKLSDAAMEQGFPLFQRPELDAQAGEPRGRIVLMDGHRMIEFFKAANASTGIHEIGHMWLDRFMRFSDREDAPESMRADRATILRELGIEHASDIDVAQHEQWARWTEQYLRTGKAPSAALASAFAKFREWLIAIYRNLRKLGAPISDDMRGVMDRLLAMPEETAEYRAPTRAVRRVQRTKDLTLAEFLAARGGIAASDPLAADVQQVFGSNPFVPGFGRLIRKDGKPLDDLRAMAVEHGYLADDEGRHGGGTTNIRDLINALNDEARGRRRYAAGHEPEAQDHTEENAVMEERHRAQIAEDVDRTFREEGLPPPTGAMRERVIELMAEHEFADPMAAFERAAMEDHAAGTEGAQNPQGAAAGSGTGDRAANEQRLESEWRKLAARPAEPVAEPKTPEVASAIPSKSRVAAEEAANQAIERFKAEAEYLPEEDRKSFEDALAEIDREQAGHMETIRRGAACLAAAEGMWG